MKLSELLKSIDYINLYGSDDRIIDGIVNDTRQVKPGDAFIALRGCVSDGHDFIIEAVEKGAVVVFCEEMMEEFKHLGAAFVLVKNTNMSMADIAHVFYDYPSKKLKIIGVTGTNGKTSTTYYLRKIFELAGFKTGVIGTNGIYIDQKYYESKNTTPNSLDLAKILNAMVNEGVEYVAMEVSSHGLTLNRVANVVFSTVVFTNLTRDHLDYHESMEDYFKAKKSLFNYKSKYKLINIDDNYGKMLFDEFKDSAVYGIGMKCSKDFAADNITQSFKFVEYDLHYVGGTIRIKSKTPGIFSVYNTMAAASVALLEGVEEDVIKKAIESVEGIKGRFEIVDTDTDYSVIIDYAHTPDGLEKVIDTINNIPNKGRTIVLFGAGGDRDKTKRPEMAKIVGTKADFAIVTSDNPRFEEPMDIILDIIKGFEGLDNKYAVIENREHAIEFALDIAKKNDIILLAGKGHETYILRKGEVIPFDESEIVKKYLMLNKEG